MRIMMWTQEQKDRADDAAYRDEIRVAMVRRRVNIEDLAKALGMSRNTMSARLRDTGKLTRDEDRRIRRFLRMEGQT